MLKKILKAVFIFCISLIFIGASVYAYYKHQESTKNKQELEFDTNVKWEWENEMYRVQVFYNEKEKVSILRKVNLEEKYTVYVIKNDDYTFTTYVEFSFDCEPGTKIDTTEKFSNGEVKVLQCDESGKKLQYSAHWNQIEPITFWNENLNGFNFNQSFTGWNFDRLDREITLKKAK
jgi:hypothetical protein